MYLKVKIILLSIILTLIEGKRNENFEISTKDEKINDRIKNETIVEFVENFSNKSNDLLTSDQNYDYVKERDNSFDNNYKNKDKSFSKEVHYFRNREFGYEKNLHWDSDSDREELKSKKVKKDLYNKRNFGKNYDLKDDMIEIKKWDDNEKDVDFNYNNNNNDFNNENNYGNKNNINYNLNINHNNDNIGEYRSDGNKDNDNYKRKYSFEEGVEGVGHTSPKDKQKWFTNMEDTDSDNSNTIKDEDNYNNYNSPKFIVNFHKFKPWDRLMKYKRNDNYNNVNNNYNSNYEIHSNSGITYENMGEEGEEDDKYSYKPKLLTDFKTRIRSNKNSNNYKNYNNNQIDRDVKLKKIRHQEIVSTIRNRPKSVRYHYEKRVLPQTYDNSHDKSDDQRRRYDFVDDRHTSMRDEINRNFIERPFDMFNTGWGTINKPMRHRSNGRTTAKIRQYRYGF